MARAVSIRKQRELFELLTAPPYPNVAQAAKHVGLAPQSVYNLCSEDPEWHAAWQAARDADRAERRAHAREQLESLLPAAVRAAAAGLQSDDENVKHKAAWKILEAFFGTAKQSVDLAANSHVVVTLDLGRHDNGDPDEASDVQTTVTLSEAI